MMFSTPEHTPHHHATAHGTRRHIDSPIPSPICTLLQSPLSNHPSIRLLSARLWDGVSYPRVFLPPEHRPHPPPHNGARHAPARHFFPALHLSQ